MCLKAEGRDQQRRSDQADESAGKPPVDAFSSDDDAQHHGADAERPAVRRPEVGDHNAKPVQRSAARRRKAEEVGQLVDDDDDGHARKKARDDGGRQQLRDPSQAQEADEGDDDTDHDGEDPDQVDVLR